MVEGVKGFLVDYLEADGDLNLLEKNFVNEIDYCGAYALWDYVPLALSLVKAGIPIDLNRVAETIDSKEFPKKHIVYGARRYIMDMVALLDAGAKANLKNLAKKVKKAKSAKKINYDEYLEIMRKLFVAGLDEDSRKFAKSVVKDLDQTKGFSYVYHANIRHPELLQLLEANGANPKIINELKPIIGARY